MNNSKVVIACYHIKVVVEGLRVIVGLFRRNVRASQAQPLCFVSTSLSTARQRRRLSCDVFRLGPYVVDEGTNNNSDEGSWFDVVAVAT